MEGFNNLTNRTGFDSALERVREISERVSEIEKSVQEKTKTTFSNVMKDLSSVVQRQKVESLIHIASREHNIDPKLVRAVIEQESGFNPNAVSKKGALGLMQLMPETARMMGAKDPLNPLENIRAGTKYLSSLLNRYRGDVVLALSAYNAGPNNVDRFKGIPPYKETKNYVKGVISKLS